MQTEKNKGNILKFILAETGQGWADKGVIWSTINYAFEWV